MTHVSKIPVDEATFRRIRNNFRGAVSAKHTHGPDILEAVLTRAERVMLRKRLAIIILLERGCSFYRISKLLKVSIATVIRIEKYRRQGRFSSIQNAMKRKNGLTLIEHMELLLAAGLPSMAGPRYNKRLKELRAKRRT